MGPTVIEATEAKIGVLKDVPDGIRTRVSPVELCSPIHWAAATIVDRMGHGFF